MDITDAINFIYDNIEIFVGTLITAAVGYYITRRKAHHHAKDQIKKGEALKDAKQLERARMEIEKAVTILEEENEPKLSSQAYLLLGDIDLSLNNWDSAIQNYTLCREYAKKIKSGISFDIINLRLGKAYMGAGRLDDAFRSIDEARQRQEKVEDNPLLAETYTKLGEIECDRAHVEIAIEHYLRSLNLQERIRDSRSQAATHSCLANLHMKKKNTNEALNHYRAAIELYKEVGNPHVAELLEKEMEEIKV